MYRSDQQYDSPETTPDENIEDQATPAQLPPQPARQRTGRARLFTSLLYWFKLILQPLIAIAAIVLLAFGFGYAQKLGYFTSLKEEGSSDNEHQQD